jgi:hypothetical protein
LVVQWRWLAWSSGRKPSPTVVGRTTMTSRRHIPFLRRRSWSPMPLCHHDRILGESPALDASKASDDASIVASMGVLPFLKASLKNWPSYRRTSGSPSITVSLVFHFRSHWSILQLFTLSAWSSLVIVVDAWPLLLSPGECFAAVCFVGGCFAVVS